MSFDAESKYGLSHCDSVSPAALRRLFAYKDVMDPVDKENLLHDPEATVTDRNLNFPWRGILNVTVLMMLTLGLLLLFIFYPVFLFYRDEAMNRGIDGNIKIKATGKSLCLPFRTLFTECVCPHSKHLCFSRCTDSILHFRHS
jgi:hypothetical protein